MIYILQGLLWWLCGEWIGGRDRPVRRPNLKEEMMRLAVGLNGGRGEGGGCQERPQVSELSSWVNG